MNHCAVGVVWEPRTEIPKSLFNVASRGRSRPENLDRKARANAMKLGQSTEGVHSPAT
jgi:hypothetical protein